jgi:undecaprenyl-diphosphatase
MTILQAILLGIIEGLTEFIPVSSTGQILVGQALMRIPPSEAMTAFLVIVQLGPLLALIVYFWKDLWDILLKTLKNLGGVRDFNALPEHARLGWYILLASIPALLIGFLLRDAVEALFKIPLLEAAIRMYAAAILMTLAEIFGKRSRRMAAINWLDALVVGIFQVLAVFPGASRSGSTISGGMLRNLDRPSAARFAFLLSAPVMLAAGAYETLKVLKMPGLNTLLLPYAFGFVAAAIVGWLAIRWLLGYLGRHSLYAFVAYCAVVGTLCLVAQFVG